MPPLADQIATARGQYQEAAAQLAEALHTLRELSEDGTLRQFSLAGLQALTADTVHALAEQAAAEVRLAVLARHYTQREEINHGDR